MPYKLFTDLPACISLEWRTKTGSLRTGILTNDNDVCYVCIDRKCDTMMLKEQPVVDYSHHFVPACQSLLIWHWSICVDFKYILPSCSFYPLFHSLSTHISLSVVHLFSFTAPRLLFPLSVLLLSILTPAIASGRPPHNKTPGGSLSSRISQFLLSSHSSGAVYAKNSYIED